MLGPKRRKAVAILIFLQAILFGLTTPIGNYSLLRFIAADPTSVEWRGLDGTSARVS